MTINIKKKIKKEKTRSYLSRDFSGFRSDLLRYARTYFPDQINDFSEASVGGLLLDMAAMIGDSMSFYMDHQFNELRWDTAIEMKNIHRHIENAGLKIPGPSPAVAEVTIRIEVPSVFEGDAYVPNTMALPQILEGTVFTGGGASFITTEDVDFSETNLGGVLLANVTTSATDPNDNHPTYFVLEKNVICLSGKSTEEYFTISDDHVPFRKISLSKPDLTDIISVEDTNHNIYYEVESLAQDTVYQGIKNINDDADIVEYTLEVKPATYRYTRHVDPNTKRTVLRFGSGDSASFDDDVIPDPSELSLPLYGKTVIPRFSLDPNKLLDTHTLGLSPRGTTIKVKYRFGGGLSHNVNSGEIKNVEQLLIKWPRNSSLPTETIRFVRDSIAVTNRFPAAGGAKKPTLDQVKKQIPSARQMQSRVVTKQDLLSRIYTLPSEFGRVFRAGLRPDPNNHLASQLFIVSLDKMGRLAFAPDSLKKNLRTYVDDFRLISDAVDVLDARILNYSVEFNIIVDPIANKEVTVQKVIRRLKDILKIEAFQIDQPIMMIDIINVIINTPDVLSLVDLSVNNMRGIIQDREYSNVSLNLAANTFKGLVVGPPGSIFELRYPDHDIIGTAS